MGRARVLQRIAGRSVQVSLAGAPALASAPLVLNSNVKIAAHDSMPSQGGQALYRILSRFTFCRWRQFFFFFASPCFGLGLGASWTGSVQVAPDAFMWMMLLLALFVRFQPKS